MMNPKYHFNRMRELIGEYKPSPERDNAEFYLNYVESWLGQCTPTEEALGRDLMAVTPGEPTDAGNEAPAV